jgi:hypothetical protein
MKIIRQATCHYIHPTKLLSFHFDLVVEQRFNKHQVDLLPRALVVAMLVIIMLVASTES